MGVVHNKAAIKRLRDGTAAAVADLQDQIDNLDPGGGLTVTVTDISEQVTGVTADVTLSAATMERYGNICIVTFIAENNGADDPVLLQFEVAPELCPYNAYEGFTNSEGTMVFDYIDGTVYIVASIQPGDGVNASVMWLINPAPAPEPTPGE